MRERRLGLLLPLVFTLAACTTPAQQEEITVKRINIVDQRGAVRLVIAGDAPGTLARGREYPRSIAPAAIIWYDEDGNESGGLAVAPLSDGRKMRMITFDFTHQLTDAVRMGTFESADGKRWMAGFEAFDRLPYAPGEIKTSQGVRRIMLGTSEADAGLTILDTKQRERIRMHVNADSVAVFEILDEQGAVVFRAPQ